MMHDWSQAYTQAMHIKSAPVSPLSHVHYSSRHAAANSRQTKNKAEKRPLTMSPPKMVVITAWPTKSFLSQPCMYVRFSTASVDSFLAISCQQKHKIKSTIRAGGYRTDTPVIHVE